MAHLKLASSWFIYITVPTLMMHGQTQINQENLEV